MGYDLNQCMVYKKLCTMIVQLKHIILFSLILSIAGQVVRSQDHRTRNNYTGAWETPVSWDPTWAVPQINVNTLDSTINGYITAYNSLSFSGNSKLIVDDTLVIMGNLTINNDNALQVNNGGILIVWGNLFFSNNSKIIADGYIIVTGDLIKGGSVTQGEFDGNEDPVKVFIGGNISPAGLTDNNDKFELLNCTLPDDPYPNSGCSYGNMEDIKNDPIYSFFQSTCATASLTSSDADNSFCAGTSITFTAGGGINYNFRVNGTSVQDGESTTYTTTTLTNGSIVDVIVTSSGGCVATSSGIINTVLALPTPAISGPTPVCIDATENVYITEAGMTNYTWSVSAGGTITAGGGTANNTVTVTWTTTGPKTVSVNYHNGNGCTATSPTIYNVTINPLPVTMTSNNGPVCAGSPLSLTGGPASMTTYSWTGPNGFTSSLQNPSVSDNATLPMSGVYTLTATNAGGCTSAATTSVIVNENPIAVAGPDQELTFVFETQMAAELFLPETGEWSLISGSGHISDIHSPTSVVTELSNGENIFLWKVQNVSCQASAEVKIMVYDLFVPSVITPDGDGKNDYFKISENIGKVYLIIFNRWGNVEYKNDDYRNEWDGRNNNGAELPFDTYFYILKFENGRIRKGSVLIKR